MTTQRVIKIVGLVNGEPSPFDGEYVVAFDVETSVLTTVATANDALVFDSVLAAGEFWKQTDGKIRPTDGKLSRPLTAFTVVIEPVRA